MSQANCKLRTLRSGLRIYEYGVTKSLTTDRGKSTSNLKSSSRASARKRPCVDGDDTLTNDPKRNKSAQAPGGHPQQTIASADLSLLMNFLATDTAGDEAATPEKAAVDPPCLTNLDTALFLEICSLLSDKDLSSLMTVCQATYFKIGDSFWYKRFITHYDRPLLCSKDDAVSSLAKAYRFRHSFLRGKTTFKKRATITALTRRAPMDSLYHEHTCMELLRKLIIESNGSLVTGRTAATQNRIIALNQDRLAAFCDPRSSNFIEDIFDFPSDWKARKGSPLSQVTNGSIRGSLPFVIYLCCAHLFLQPEYDFNVRQFEISQRRMYSENRADLIFSVRRDWEINVSWLVHAVNFWRWNLTLPHQGVLAHAFSLLPQDELPQRWLGRLKSGTQSIGGCWKGAYLLLNEDALDQRRRSTEDEIPDEIDAGETFQDLSILHSDQLNESNWPQCFEWALQGRLLKTLPVDRHFFSGLIRSSEDQVMPALPIYGFVHALPQQNGIDGFQRVAFLQIHHDEKHTIWGYEGCVLPGGRIILGQWYGLADGQVLSSSGPFILWSIDVQHQPRMDVDEAMKFLKYLQETGEWF